MYECIPLLYDWFLTSHEVYVPPQRPPTTDSIGKPCNGTILWHGFQWWIITWFRQSSDTVPVLLFRNGMEVYALGGWCLETLLARSAQWTWRCMGDHYDYWGSWFSLVCRYGHTLLNSYQCAEASRLAPTYYRFNHQLNYPTVAPSTFVCWCWNFRERMPSNATWPWYHGHTRYISRRASCGVGR